MADSHPIAQINSAIDRIEKDLLGPAKALTEKLKPILDMTNAIDEAIAAVVAASNPTVVSGIRATLHAANGDGQYENPTVTTASNLLDTGSTSTERLGSVLEGLKTSLAAVAAVANELGEGQPAATYQQAIDKLKKVAALWSGGSE